ncbi:bacteriocin immunity protein [Dactylosporangium sp. NPDC051485]|uniref:bacteriocin immunity protein n=1 Tax=Dactylosporangium sp. NPDC051485 TaxID=3154846 RepID=UPI00342A0146
MAEAANVTRDELIEIVRRIQAADDDMDYYVLLLSTNVSHPGAIDLIFHPPADLADASPEAVIDAALSYRPIAL